jgi:hypothetical protein
MSLADKKVFEIYRGDVFVANTLAYDEADAMAKVKQVFGPDVDHYKVIESGYIEED